MEYTNENFDKEKYAAERKQEMEDIAAKLEKRVVEIFNGENYKNYLKFCAKMPRYSINNQYRNCFMNYFTAIRLNGRNNQEKVIDRPFKFWVTRKMVGREKEKKELDKLYKLFARKNKILKE